MKRFFLELLPLALIMTVLALIVIHAPLSIYAGTLLPDIAVPLKAWKEVLIMVAGVLVAIKMLEVGQWKILKTDKFGWVLIAFWVLHAVALLWSHGSLQTQVAGLLIDLRYTFFAAVMFHFVLLYPQYRGLFRKILIAGSVVVIGFAALELVLPKDILKYLGYGPHTIEPYLTVDKNPDYIRYNSTLRGPNSLGAYAVMVLAGATAFWATARVRLEKGWQTIVFWVLAVGAVNALWISYSRSAALAALLAIGLVVIARYGKRISPKLWVVGTAVLLTIILVGYAARNTSFVANVILHNNPTTGAAIDSNTAHADSLKMGVAKMLAEPLGGGIGSTGSASILGDKPQIIENEYLMIAHEVGWLGLVLFLWIYGVFLARLWRQRHDWLALAVFASGIGLGFIGLMLPVWADDTIALVWWGAAGMVLAKGELDERTANKKAKRIA